jgi:hypothetical protein
MVIAILYGCALGAAAAFPADYLWRRRAYTLGPVPRIMFTAAILSAIALGGRFHIYHGGWTFWGVLLGLMVSAFAVHASAARWWAPVGPARSNPRPPT